jgi:hypothetical protein
MAGYNIQLANPMFEIMPSLMVQSDLADPIMIYLNSNLRYNKKFLGWSFLFSGRGLDSALWHRNAEQWTHDRVFV